MAATHDEIAAELGTAREVVSRLLQKLVRTGAIEVGRGRIELRDESVLRESISRAKGPARTSAAV
jgi:CRP/FNR family transcriptional regulator